MPVRFPRVRPHRCRITTSVDHTLSTATWTSLTWNTETYDTDNMHSTDSDTERITINHAGTYLLIGYACFDPNATGRRLIRFLKNGTTTLIENQNTSPSGTQFCHVFLTDTVILAVDDYCTFDAYQDSGGDLNTFKTWCFFSAIRIA